MNKYNRDRQFIAQPIVKGMVNRAQRVTVDYIFTVERQHMSRLVFEQVFQISSYAKQHELNDALSRYTWVVAKTLANDQMFPVTSNVV